MKSTDIKNWSYELSYKNVAELDDFVEILTKAITSSSCILCGSIGGSLLNDGLCLGCSHGLIGKDRKVSNYMLKNVEVLVRVGLSDTYKEELVKLLEKI